MTRDEALARADLEGMLEGIGAARGLHRRGKQFPCPSAMHEQTGATPPATLDPDGRLWHCHSCDAGGTIIDAMVMSGMAADVGEALRRLGVDDGHREADPPPRVIEAEYVYTDAKDRPLFKVVRYRDKQFRQQRWDNGTWKWGLDGVERTLFQLPEVLRAKELGHWIFVTEGEKDALAVAKLGKCATTLPGGAGKWRDEYTAILTGANVVILADDDEVGRKHAAQVYRALYGRANKLGVRLPREGCKDIADHLAAGASLNGDLRKAPELQAATVSPATGRSALTAAVFSARPSIDSPVLGPLFQRGMRTVIGAQTGEGKTTLSLQAIAALVEGQPLFDWTPTARGRALVVDLEQGEETLKTRLRESGLASSERVDILWEPNGIALDKREEDRAMVRDILRDGGYDIVLLDPLYQLHLGSGNDEAVAAETMRIVDGWAREFGCCLVLPMHMRKPHVEAGKNITIHDIAGVGTWLRNAEFVLGLQVMSAGQSRLHFFKDRIGRGPEIRSHWWLDFDRDAGFRRNYREDKMRAQKAMKDLVAREEGASLEELEAVKGAIPLSDPTIGVGTVKSIVRACDERDGRYYKRKPKPKGHTVSAEQTAIDMSG